MAYKAKEVIANIHECFEKYPKELTKSALETTYYEDISTLEIKAERLYKKPSITVENCDTISAGKKLKDKGLNPVCINMASAWKPGGGWRKGSMAQEESLFYRSTFAVSLEDCLKIRKRNFYPLSKRALIYSPSILVFKDKYYQLLDWPDCYFLDFIAIAAIRKPKLCSGRFTPEDFQITEEKVDGFFKVAYEKGHDSLVLGALGCGAYSNPVKEIVKIFNRCLERWKHHFKQITFAIINDRNGRENFQLFEQGIKK